MRVNLPPISPAAAELRATVEREAAHATDDAAMVGAAIVLGHDALNQIAQDRGWPSELVYVLSRAACQFDDLTRPHPYRCGWEGATGRCDEAARPGYKTCERHRRFESSAGDYRPAAFAPGDWVLHLDGTSEAREVVDSTPETVTLRLPGGLVSRPLPAHDYRKA